jgi:cyclase
MTPNQVRLLAGSLLGATVLLSPAGPSHAQQRREPDWNRITFRVHKLAGSVYMFEGVGGYAGGNIATSVGADGALLVDASLAPLAKKLEAELRKLSNKPLRFIVNTHFHGDHTSGNAAFGTRATVIAHANTRARLIKQGFMPEMPAPPHALPMLTIDGPMTLHLNGEEVRLSVPGPAHTDSDVIVHFKNANVVHLGDLFFNGMYPFIDLNHGGDVKGYVATLEKTLAELPADARIVPGHGPLASRADLEAYLAMIKESIALVESGIAQNRSAASLKHAKVLAKYDETWGKGLISTDEWLDHLYRGLSPRK